MHEEGLAPGFTHPSAKTYHHNAGAAVVVCAGLRGGRVILRQYTAGPWGESVAESLGHHDASRVLARGIGRAKGSTTLDGGGLGGYTSGKAIQSATALSIRAMSLSHDSPDLPPLSPDYSLWADIDRRVHFSTPTGRESNAACTWCLRTTALVAPGGCVRRVVQQMKQWVVAVYAANGGDRPLD